jgi:2'-5' RNA ligase
VEQWRLFVAIELPDDAKQELGKLQNKLHNEGLDGVKWVFPQSLHITLKFLGYTDQEKVEEINHALNSVSKQFDAFTIGFKRLGAFPALSRARVLWTGLTGEIGRLQMLAGEVERAMNDLGFEEEKRKYSPHLTLARVQPSTTPFEQQKIAEVIGGMEYTSLVQVRVNAISLMRSHLSSSGASYDRIYSTKLGIARQKGF